MRLVDPSVFHFHGPPPQAAAFRRRVTPKEVEENIQCLSRYIFYGLCFILFAFVISRTTSVFEILQERINKE